MGRLIEWTDELSVGIQEIDEQHKILVNLINELYGAMIKGGAKETNGAILRRLVDYTKTHFTVEESLMRIMGYSDYDAHKKRHDDFVAQLKELQQKFDQGQVHISMELLNFLKDWLSNHIMKTDKQYGPYFLKKGAKSTWWRKFW